MEAIWFVAFLGCLVGIIERPWWAGIGWTMLAMVCAAMAWNPVPDGALYAILGAWVVGFVYRMERRVRGAA
jgi:hypothetical protein